VLGWGGGKPGGPAEVVGRPGMGVWLGCFKEKLFSPQHIGNIISQNMEMEIKLDEIMFVYIT